MEYLEFLKTKVELATESGFAVEPSQLNNALKPHQRDAVHGRLGAAEEEIETPTLFDLFPGVV